MRDAIERHDADLFAHEPMRGSMENRLTSLEKWRWFISGGLAMLSFISIGVGGVIFLGNMFLPHHP